MQSALPIAGRSLRRAFSTSSVCQAAAQKVKAPVALFGIDGRYATALYTAAAKNNKLDAVEKDIDHLRGLLKTDIKLMEFVKDPTYKRGEKVKAMASVSQKLKQQDLTTNFLASIAENGRMTKLRQILKAFETLMAAHKGQVVCHVVTAKALDSSMQKQVEAALAGFTTKGQKVQITYDTDPSIIGGMKVTIGDKFVDMSIASKINTYQQLIDQTIV